MNAFPGLTRATTYYFRLRADNADQFQPQRGVILSVNLLGGSPPVFVSATSEAGGRRVRWKDQTAFDYRVEYCDFLLAGWQSFPGTVTSSGGVVEYLDTTSPAPTQRFYRLVSPP